MGVVSGLKGFFGFYNHEKKAPSGNKKATLGTDV